MMHIHGADDSAVARSKSDCRRVGGVAEDEDAIPFENGDHAAGQRVAVFVGGRDREWSEGRKRESSVGGKVLSVEVASGGFEGVSSIVVVAASADVAVGEEGHCRVVGGAEQPEGVRCGVVLAGKDINEDDLRLALLHRNKRKRRHNQRP